MRGLGLCALGGILGGDGDVVDGRVLVDGGGDGDLTGERGVTDGEEMAMGIIPRRRTISLPSGDLPTYMVDFSTYFTQTAKAALSAM